MSESLLDARKARARTWFETLRNDICAVFEALEAGLPSPSLMRCHRANVGGFAVATR